MNAPAAVSGGAQTRGDKLTIALCFAVIVVEGFDIQAMGVAAPKHHPLSDVRGLNAL